MATPALAASLPEPVAPSGPRPPAPSAGGGFDVRPQHLYWISQLIATHQSAFHKAGQMFATNIDHGGAAGSGSASATFARAYDTLVRRYLELWSRSVVSVGGAATGFTVTANNYRAADHATDPKAKGTPPRQTPPRVIQQPPHYPLPSSVLMAGADGDSTSLWDVGAEIGMAVPEQLLDAATKYVLGMPRFAEITPLANTGQLNNITVAWRAAVLDAKGTAAQCAEAVSAITRSSHDEWQQAMRRFAQNLWGASTGGGGQKSGGQAVLETLDRVASEAATSCDQLAAASRKVDADVSRIARGAVATGPLGVNPFFPLELDHAALDTAITEYENTLRNLATQLDARTREVDEAIVAAPTFRAEAARAQAFGARSLHEFRKDPLYTVPNDAAGNHTYPVDLANQGSMAGAHTIDRHVGQTADQLAARLSHQPQLEAASSFHSLADAQKYTQAALDDPSNQNEIERWLTRAREQGTDATSPLTLHRDYGDSVVTGQMVTRESSVFSLFGPGEQPAHGVEVTLKYQPEQDPPYVVVQSRPR